MIELIINTGEQEIFSLDFLSNLIIIKIGVIKITKIITKNNTSWKMIGE